MKTSEALKKAKAIIANPAKWTRAAFARDEEGNSVDPSYEKATCFCSWGALMKIDSVEPFDVSKALRKLDASSPERGIVYQNDNTYHDKVMAIWDAAIKHCEEEDD